MEAEKEEKAEEGEENGVGRGEEQNHIIVSPYPDNETMSKKSKKLSLTSQNGSDRLFSLVMQ